MTTRDRILAKANEFFHEKGYVSVKELSTRVNLSVNYLYKQVDLLKYERRWPYRRYNGKTYDAKQTIIGRVKALLEENPDISYREAHQTLGLAERQYRVVREYLWRLRQP